jgi:hypothetical protein
LIILSVKLNRCDGVSMSNKCLYLFLVVNVPDPDNSVLAATDQVLSISGETQWLIEVTVDGTVVLLSLE